MSGRTGHRNTAYRSDVGVFSPDRLFAGEQELLRHEAAKIRVDTGGELLRGCLMGRILSASAVRPTAGNTGNATFAASIGGARQAEIGRYQIRCTTAGNAGSARYSLAAPDGEVLAQGLASGSASTPARSITVTPTAGSADVAVGDSWSFAVRPERWERVDPGSETGSAIPAGILVQEVAAANGSAIAGDANHVEVNGHVYTQGVFDWNCVDLATEGRTEVEEAVSYDHGYELADIAAQLKENGLVLLDSMRHRNDPLVTSTDRADWL